MSASTEGAARQAAPMPWLWLIPAIYLAAWSTVFGIWSFVDGAGVFRAFGLEMAGDPFVLMNSGARYLGIAAALLLALWLRHPVAVITALAARLVMDLGDVAAGLRAGLLDPLWAGLAQSAAMFLIPGALGLWLALRWRARTGL